MCSDLLSGVEPKQLLARYCRSPPCIHLHGNSDLNKDPLGWCSKAEGTCRLIGIQPGCTQLARRFLCMSTSLHPSILYVKSHVVVITARHGQACNNVELLLSTQMPQETGAGLQSCILQVAPALQAKSHTPQSKLKSSSKMRISFRRRNGRVKGSL